MAINNVIYLEDRIKIPEKELIRIESNKEWFENYLNQLSRHSRPELIGFPLIVESIKERIISFYYRLQPKQNHVAKLYENYMKRLNLKSDF